MAKLPGSTTFVNLGITLKAAILPNLTVSNLLADQNTAPNPITHFAMQFRCTKVLGAEKCVFYRLDAHKMHGKAWENVYFEGNAYNINANILGILFLEEKITPNGMERSANKNEMDAFTV